MLDEGNMYIEGSIDINWTKMNTIIQGIEDKGKVLKELISEIKASMVKEKAIEKAPVYPAQINWHKFDELNPDPASEVLIVTSGYVHYAYYNTDFTEGLALPRFFTKQPFDMMWFPKSIDYWAYLPNPPIDEV